MLSFFLNSNPHLQMYNILVLQIFKPLRTIKAVSETRKIFSLFCLVKSKEYSSDLRFKDSSTFTECEALSEHILSLTVKNVAHLLVGPFLSFNQSIIVCIFFLSYAL